MRIYDSDSDKKIDNVILYLTYGEAQEMKDALEMLLSNRECHHEHIPDRENDFKREITVCLYDENNLRGFDARSIKLIKEDV